MGFLAVVLPFVAVYGFVTENPKLSWPALVCGVAAIGFVVFRSFLNRRS